MGVLHNLMNHDLLQVGVPTVGSTGVWVRVAQPRGRGDVLFSVLFSGYFALIELLRLSIDALVDFVYFMF